jgi:hypothetical protein
VALLVFTCNASQLVSSVDLGLHDRTTLNLFVFALSTLYSLFSILYSLHIYFFLSTCMVSEPLQSFDPCLQPFFLLFSFHATRGSVTLFVLVFVVVDAQNFYFDGRRINPRVGKTRVGFVWGVLSPKLYIKLDRPPDG